MFFNKSQQTFAMNGNILMNINNLIRAYSFAEKFFFHFIFFQISRHPYAGNSGLISGHKNYG